MKRTMFLLSALLLAGCSSSLKHVPKYQSITLIDFSKYSAKGFLITSEPYGGKYKSLGLMNLVIRAEATRKDTLITIHRSGINTSTSITKWDIGKLGTDEILDSAYSLATALGGDAIMNFKITPNDKVYNDGLETIAVPGIEIYGFIIKRE